MTGKMSDRVVLITGAGRGIGRAYALAFAREGAKVVVNDLETGGESPAEDVVREIQQQGGSAIATGGDVTTWAGAEDIVNTALNEYGRLDVLVNNAGILRDRMFVNMTEQEWDDVIAVHLKGTFCVSRHAVNYWRHQSKAGAQVDARIINTTSASGLYGNIGQVNYGAAKAGIAAMTVAMSEELSRYGITVNAISPAAITRMTEGLRERSDEEQQLMDPKNIAPLVVWLGSAQSAEVTGRVFNVKGQRISVAEGWRAGPEIDRDDAWAQESLSEVIPTLVAKAQGKLGLDGYPY